MTSTRRRRGVPGPIRRLLRERARTAAVILVAFSALATAAIQVGAATAMRTSLDANWRGAYDILVTPASGSSAVDGMLPPNSLASGKQGLSSQDLDAVRAISGVEVAAPIGEIIVPGFKSILPNVAVPAASVPEAASGPQAYRVTAEYTTNDGLGERFVSSSRSNVVIDGTPTPPATPCDTAMTDWNGWPIDAAEFPLIAQFGCPTDLGPGLYQFTPEGGGYGFGGLGSGSHDAGIYTMTLQDSPVGATRITLVDPIAEKALLGSRGGFLGPLASFGDGLVTGTELEAWATTDTSGFGTSFLDDLNAAANTGGASDAVRDEFRRLYAAHGQDWDAQQIANAIAQRAFPLLVSDAPAAQLSLKLTVESFGPVARNPGEVSTPFAFPEALLRGDPGTPVGSTSVDVSGALNPFVRESARIPWPGAPLESADALPDYHGVAIVNFARAMSGSFTTRGGQLVLEPSGYRAPVLDPADPTSDAVFSLSASAHNPGNEAAYLDLRDGVSVVDSTDGGAVTLGAVATPVGSFSPDEIASADAVNYVPLGAYAPVGSTIADGEHAGTELQPAVTGLGLVSPRTIAIGSLGAAEQLGLKAPINSIRVRVGGITGYTPEAQQRVLDVAAQIRALGYQTTVVAGSSPADVTVGIDGYAFGTTDPDGIQFTGSLGDVVQRWSELGAAARADLAISGATVAIVAIGLASAILLFMALQLTAIPRRREQAFAMREVGFTRARIAAWSGAEEVPGIVVIAVTIAGAMLLSASELIDRLLIGVLALVVLVSAAAVIAGSRARTPRPTRIRRSRARRLGARTIGAFGARQAWKHPLTSFTQLLAIAIVAAAAAGLVSVLLRGRAAAGQSLLAGYLADQQFLPQLALGVTAVLAGAVLAGVARRMELQRRRVQWSTLRATGWTGRQIARAQRSEAAAIVTPSLLVAVGAVVAGVILLDLPQPILLSVVAGVAAAATALTTLSVRSKGSRA